MSASENPVSRVDGERARALLFLLGALEAEARKVTVTAKTWTVKRWTKNKSKAQTRRCSRVKLKPEPEPEHEHHL